MSLSTDSCACTVYCDGTGWPIQTILHLLVLMDGKET